MKANHNGIYDGKQHKLVVVNISSSKNESKSQHGFGDRVAGDRCCKYQ